MEENVNLNEEIAENEQNDEIVDVAQDEKKGILADMPKGKKTQKVLTPEQKKKRRLKAIIITTSVVLMLAIFFGVCAIVNVTGTNALIEQGKRQTAVVYGEGEQLVPVKDTDGYWTFTTDRDLKVMQFTDVHIGGGCFSQQKDAWAMNAVANMIRSEKPDLVVVTGDIAYPVPFQAGTFNNLNATKIFSNMMESLGVYWTFAFGNHDTEAYSMYTREDICDYYESAGLKYCLFNRGFAGEEHGYGNNIIKVKNSSGIVTQAIVTFDSHSYTDGDYFGIAWKYDNIHQSQVDWYEGAMKSFQAKNVEIATANSIEYTKTAVDNLAFFHIPLKEYRNAWANVIETYGNSETMPKAGDVFTGADGSTTTYLYGNMGESDKNKNGTRTYGVFCGYKTDVLFDTGLENGLQGIFCGHDHYNNFSVEYKKHADDERSIRLTYGMSVDYLAYVGIYKEHSQRGTTVITVSPDGSFDVQAKNYYSDYQYDREVQGKD